MKGIREIIAVLALSGVLGLGGCERVQVVLEDDVPRHLCSRVLHNLEELMTSTSAALRDIEGAAEFSTVTVRLPPSWNTATSECLSSRSVSESRGTRAPRGDVLVTSGGAAADTLFGSRPVARQFGQCGARGRRLELPQRALAANQSVDAAAGRAMLREWLKYRFGVFEEAGFEGDRIYPLKFVEGLQELENRGCNDTVSFPICPLEEYNADATTKQNILCDGRGARRVILDSAAAAAAESLRKSDNGTSLEGGEADQMEDKETEPLRFEYLLPSKPQLFVLVLDRSSLPAAIEEETAAEDASHLNWESLQKALFQFIARLPSGANLAIITYGAAAAVSLPPTAVTDANREGLHGRIPRRALTAHETDSCLDCALRTAFKVMRSGEKVEGTIVLATKSTGAQVVSEEQVNLVRDNGIPVYAIALSADGRKSGGVEELTRLGGSFVIPHSGNNRPKYMSHLSDALTGILRESSGSEMVACHRDTRVPNVDNIIAGNFVVEEHLRNDLWISVTADDERDVESFEVLSPTGERHSFPTYEHGLAYFRLAGAAEPGIWSYTLRLYPTLASHYPVYLEVLGRPSSPEEGAAIRLEAWHTQAGEAGTDIYLYAEVRQGALPVLDAKVVATVTRPLGDDGVETVEVELRDLGTGYPDVTRGDGIYSGYFTDLSRQSGSYQVTVRADHNGGHARTPKRSASSAGAADDVACCGSAVAPVSYTIPTGPFQRFVAGPSFFVEQPSSFYVRGSTAEGASDVFPPSRITDFAFDNYLDDSLFVTLRWTAPGGDRDAGKAFRYEIRCYTNREALRDGNFADMSIPVHASLIPAPEESGAEQRCTVGVPWPNEVFYYAIVAFDEAGNRGKISNTVSVYIKEEPSTETAPGGTENDVESPVDLPLTSGDQNSVVFIVVGIVCGVLVVLIVLTVVAIRRHYLILTGALKRDCASSSSGDETASEDGSSLADTLKKIIPMAATVATEDKGSRMVWASGSSPTSDYSSQKSPLPSISETLARSSYRRHPQRDISWRQTATSQALPAAVHRRVTDTVSSVYEGGSTSTDCGSSIEEKKSEVDSLQQKLQWSPLGAPPRISVMEDCSVYRDLSNISNCDYFSFSQLPAELSGEHVITVPPYYDIATIDSSSKQQQQQQHRHESLV